MEESEHKKKHSVRRLIFTYLFLAVVPLLLYTIAYSFQIGNIRNVKMDVQFFTTTFLQKDFLIYLLIGFLAQMVDGALGMAYGVTSTTFLLNAGLSPLAASASVHMAEIFTTGVSGISHLRFGNVDKALFRRLAIPAVIGSALGAIFHRGWLSWTKTIPDLPVRIEY